MNLTWPHIHRRRADASLEKVTLNAEATMPLDVFAFANGGGLSGNRILKISPALKNSEYEYRADTFKVRIPLKRHRAPRNDPRNVY